MFRDCNGNGSSICFAREVKGQPNTTPYKMQEHALIQNPLRLELGTAVDTWVMKSQANTIIEQWRKIAMSNHRAEGP